MESVLYLYVKAQANSPVQAFSFQCCSTCSSEGRSRAWHCCRTAAGSCRVCRYSVGTQLFAHYRRTIPIRKRIIKTASPRSKARQSCHPVSRHHFRYQGYRGQLQVSRFIHYYQCRTCISAIQKIAQVGPSGFTMTREDTLFLSMMSSKKKREVLLVFFFRLRILNERARLPFFLDAYASDSQI